MQNRTEQLGKLGGGARARGETAEATSGETDERRPADGRAGRRKRTQRGERSAAGCDGRVARRVVQRPGGERVVVRRRGWSDPVGRGGVGWSWSWGGELFPRQGVKVSISRSGVIVGISK